MKCSPALLLIAIAGCASAADVATLPLDKGTYILDSAGAAAACADVPNAGTLYFDGNSVIGPHGEPCTSKIVSVDGKRYTIESACIAFQHGDVVLPTLQTTVVKVGSRSRFALQNGQKEWWAFHRCGPYPGNVPLHAEFHAD